MAEARSGRRPWTFYALAAFFTLFVLFLYGPMSAIYILSFQGPNGGLTFPLNGVSLNWFYALFQQQRTGDIAGSFARSIALALIVLVLTVVISVMAGLAFRRRFVGAGVLFYMAIASLIMPGLLVSLGIGLMFQFLGIRTSWYTSALGAHLTWTLPFGLLIMFAVFSRFNRAYEEAGARPRRRQVGDPLDDRPADPAARHDRGGAVRLHALLRRVPAHLDRGRPEQHAAARDLEHDHQRHLARPLRDRHRDHRGLVPGDRAGAGLDRADPAPAHPARAAHFRRTAPDHGADSEKSSSRA